MKADVKKSKRGRKQKNPDPVFAIVKDDQETVMVPVEKLKIDERYQFHPEKEPLRLSRFNRWLTQHGGYSPALAGAIHGCIRKDEPDSVYVLDGYGRVWMGTRMVDKPIKEIPVILHKGLKSWKEEASLFLELNRNKRSIKTPHLFVVAANAGHKPEVDILPLVIATGYGVERLVHKKCAILAPSALIFADALGGNILELALYDLRHTWGDEGVDGRHLVQLAAVIASNSRVDHGRIRDIYKKWGAIEAAREARAVAQLAITTRNPQSRDTNPYFARCTIRKYNYRLEKDRRLDPEALGSLIERFTSENQYRDVWDFKA